MVRNYCKNREMPNIQETKLFVFRTAVQFRQFQNIAYNYGLQDFKIYLKKSRTDAQLRYSNLTLSFCKAKNEVHISINTMHDICIQSD